MDEEEKRCGNCKYFSRHYFKYKEKLLKADCGNCVNPARPVSAGKKCGNGNYVCRLWEPYEIQLTERREAIKEKLQCIAESLNDVALILKDDEQGLKK